MNAPHAALLEALRACRSEIWRLLDVKGIHPKDARQWPEIVAADKAIAAAIAQAAELPKLLPASGNIDFIESWINVRREAVALAHGDKSISSLLGAVETYAAACCFELSQSSAPPVALPMIRPDEPALMAVPGAVWGMHGEQGVCLIQRGTENARIAKSGGQRLYILAPNPGAQESFTAEPLPVRGCVDNF